MKRWLVIIMLCAFIVSVVFTYISGQRVQMVIDNTDVDSIIVHEKKQEKEYSSQEWIEGFLQQLNGATLTKKNSVQDTPLVEDYITIELKYKESIYNTVLYLYQSDNVWLIEKPYEGIYKINFDIEAVMDQKE